MRVDSEGAAGFCSVSVCRFVIVGRPHVAPEVRWVWGGPARVGNNYDEGTIGARVVWKF